MNKKARKIPIKFRGIDIETGEYVYGSLVICGCCNEHTIVDSKNAVIPIINESVSQLVGYDADGREVYEGDGLYLDYPEDDFHKEYKASVMALALSADGCYHNIGKVKLKGAD